MAAYAALVSLMNNIQQIMNHPRLSNCFDNQERIQSVLQNLGFLIDFIEGYNYGGSLSKEAEALERQIRRVAHGVEDVIESHVVDQIHAGTICPLDLQEIVEVMDELAVKARDVKEKEGVREEEQPPIHPRPLVESSRETTAMVGLDGELTQLLESLTDHHSNRQVISIVGMGGTGKTTLAQNVYANPLTVERFDIRAWVIVSQSYNVKEILSQILSSLGNVTEGGDLGELGEQLHRTLFGKRYLIVLDDIWSVQVWDAVRRYLPDVGNKSRVVLTTRLSDLAATVCGSSCLNLNLLDEDKSWELFCQKALFPHVDDPPQLEDIAKEIVKSCKGLGLSIVVIGGLLLKSPRTVGYWKNVLKGLEKNDSKEKQQGLDALSLSYDHLPAHLKPCFLYIGVLKEDLRIHVSYITRLWIAEGFIKPKGSRVLEDIAEGYLKDLSDRNLVLDVERRFSGEIKSFRIHDLLRDLCIKVSEQQQFFHVRELGEIQGTERRFVCNPYESQFGTAVLLRSSLGEKWVPAEYVECKLLRVLESYIVDEFSRAAEVYENVNLRYLDQELSSDCGYEVEFPIPSTCLLWNLQTVNIRLERGEYPLVYANVGFWKMRQLRHVKCMSVYLCDPPPPRDEQDYMDNLQTLKGAVNLRLSEELCQIIPNIKKLSFVLDCHEYGYDDSLIECLHNLERLHKLESLYLDIGSGEWPYQGSGIAFPLSLKQLGLRNCKLSCEDMSIISSLPQLQVLHLNFYGITVGKQWSPISGQFLSLKLLEIEYCHLVSWDADSSHFPVLEKLVLRGWPNLEGIPLEIGEIPTLELIRVDRCSESASISAVRIKKDELENHDNEALQIEVVVSESNLESFKKRVEAEELALDLFRLETTR